MLKLYDSLTKTTQELDLNKEIGIYVCGITPYDTTHLGHAFTYLAYDLLTRYLRFQDIKVTYVQNVTDIDDDILKRARRDGRDWKILGQEETAKFLEDMQDLNWTSPTHYLKATEHVDEMAHLIQNLLDKGFAYEKNGSVYFEVKKDPEFAKRLVTLNYDAALTLANERGNNPIDTNKKDPLDFVLWQKAAEKEPSWESPFGSGRPGWHIECSAMSTKFLLQPISIHGGGEDLKFPHHEAEISQSEKANEGKFVETWMHVAMVFCDGDKMSKSLGNMIFVRDLLTTYSSDTVRLYLLMQHYRKEWEYSRKEIEKVSKIVQKLKINLSTVAPAQRKVISEDLELFKLLNDDLNSPAAVNEFLKLADGSLQEKQTAKLIGQEIFGLTFK